MIKNVQIKELIPQREPIIMVSRLIHAEKNMATTELYVQEDNIFCSEGKLSEPGIIENIAQTAAAMSGYHAFKNQEKVKKGFIGSVENLIIHELPKQGNTISTNVEVENEVMNVQIIKGEIKLGNKLLAECKMKIFLEE